VRGVFRLDCTAISAESWGQQLTAGSLPPGGGAEQRGPLPLGLPPLGNEPWPQGGRPCDKSSLHNRWFDCSTCAWRLQEKLSKSF